MAGKANDKGTSERRPEERERRALPVSGAELRADAKAPGRGQARVLPEPDEQVAQEEVGEPRSWGHGENFAIYSRCDGKPLRD